MIYALAKYKEVPVKVEAAKMHTGTLSDEIRRYTINCETANQNTGEALEILGDYEQYLLCWGGNTDTDCFKVVRRPDGYYIIPFGKEPDGFVYEEFPSGPYATNTTAEQEAISRLKIVMCH
jgi:hypothetical protein